MRPLKSCLLVCLFALVFSVTPAAASTITEVQSTSLLEEVQPATSIAELLPARNYDIYLKLDGIAGDALTKNYEKWIQLSGVQFNVANVASGNGGSGGTVGKTTLNNFIITKQLDSSSIPLFLDTVSGKQIKNGKLVFVTRAREPMMILAIDLGIILVSEYKFINANEIFTLKFDSLRMTYYPTDPSGKKLPPISGGWDFSKNRITQSNEMQ